MNNDQVFDTLGEAKAHYEQNGEKYYGTIFRNGEDKYVLVESTLPLGDSCFQVLVLKWEIVGSKVLASAAWHWYVEN